ncbi:MAG: IS630 family transposase [Silvanigrellaceae bacterium]|nr:IS630 family transposase [Silvanigrellaceae bacterium]
MEYIVAPIIKEIKFNPKKIFTTRKVQRLLIVVLKNLPIAVTSLSEMFECNSRTVEKWLRRFSQEGLSGLEEREPSGRPPILLPEEKESIGSVILRNADECFASSARCYAQEIGVKFNKIYSKTSVYRLYKNFKISFRKVRPVHEKNDAIAMQNCQAELPTVLEKVQQESPGKEVEMYFQDETRYGQRTISTRVWTYRNKELRYRNQNGFLNSWIYGAINPVNGKKFSLILSRLDSQNMQILINSLSNQIEPNKVILLILDGSKAHRDNILHIPKNIKFHFLPPYSPELNPIESLWIFIKNKYLSFKLYKDFSEIEAADLLISKK